MGGEGGGAGSRVAVTPRSCSLNMRERCEDRSCEQWGRMRSDMAPESRQRWFTAVVAAAVAAVWVRRVVLPARPRTAPLPIPHRIPDPEERPAPDGTGVRIVVNPSSGPAWTEAPTDALREGLPGADIHELDPDDRARRPAVPRRPRRHRRGGRRRHPRGGRHHRRRARRAVRGRPGGHAQPPGPRPRPGDRRRRHRGRPGRHRDPHGPRGRRRPVLRQHAHLRRLLAGRRRPRTARGPHRQVAGPARGARARAAPHGAAAGGARRSRSVGCGSRGSATAATTPPGSARRGASTSTTACSTSAS